MRKHARTRIVIALSVGLFALFLRGAHLDVVWAEIQRGRSWLLALSCAVTVLTMVFRALRWQYLLAPIGPARFGTAFRTTMIGVCRERGAFRRAPVRSFAVSACAAAGLSATATSFATIIIERLLDAITCVMLLGIFVMFFDPGMDRADSRLYRLVEIGAITVGALALALLWVMFVAARDPEAAGRWAYNSNICSRDA